FQLVSQSKSLSRAFKITCLSQNRFYSVSNSRQTSVISPSPHPSSFANVIYPISSPLTFTDKILSFPEAPRLFSSLSKSLIKSDTVTSFTSILPPNPFCDIHAIHAPARSTRRIYTYHRPHGRKSYTSVLRHRLYK